MARKRLPRTVDPKSRYARVPQCLELFGRPNDVGVPIAARRQRGNAPSRASFRQPRIQELHEGVQPGFQLYPVLTHRGPERGMHVKRRS